jgi:hypothetical protein
VLRSGDQWHAWTRDSAHAAVGHALATGAPRIELGLWFEGDSPRLRTTAVVPVPVSVSATAQNLDASAAAFVGDELVRLGHLGIEAEPPAPRGVHPVDEPIAAPPSARVVAAVGARLAAKARDRVVGRRDQWVIGWRPRSDAPVGAGDFTVLDVPRGEDWADPFLWREGEREVLFLERAPAGGRGEIHVADVGPEGPRPQTARPVVRRPHHLSFPTLFHHDGALYLTMESGEARVTEVLRCVAFPDQWEPVARILEGVALFDPVLLPHDGRWFLLGTVAAPGEWGIRTLHVWHAHSPLAAHWTPHPANPICTDPALARNAGVPFRDDAGRLIRPSQYCHGAYGLGLNLMCLDHLGTDRVEQTLLERYVPVTGRCHTYSRSAAFEAVDFLRTTRREA